MNLQENMNPQEKPNAPVGRHIQFGNTTFTQEEHSAIQAALRQRLGREFLSHRPGPGNQKITYMEGQKYINLANEIFGFNGWTDEVVTSQIDFLDERGGKHDVGAYALVRVTLKDGCSHMGIGYGLTENVRSKGLGVEKARKEAETDALKRALRKFGNVLGNCISDKEYIQAIMKTAKPGKQTYDTKEMKHNVLDPDITNARKTSFPSPTLQPTTPLGLPLPRAHSTPANTAMPPPWRGNSDVRSGAGDSCSRRFCRNPESRHSSSIADGLSASYVPCLSTGPTTNTGLVTKTGPSACSGKNNSTVPSATSGPITNTDSSYCSRPNTSGPAASAGSNTSSSSRSDRIVPGTSRSPGAGPVTGAGPDKSVSPSKKKRASPRTVEQKSRTSPEADEAARLRKQRQWEKQQEFRQQLATKQDRSSLPRALTSLKVDDGMGTLGNRERNREMDSFEAGMDDSLLANVADSEIWSEKDSAGVMTRSRTPKKHGGHRPSGTLQQDQGGQRLRGPVVSRDSQHGWSGQHKQPAVKKRRVDST